MRRGACQLRPWCYRCPRTHFCVCYRVPLCGAELLPLVPGVPSCLYSWALCYC